MLTIQRDQNLGKIRPVIAPQEGSEAVIQAQTSDPPPQEPDPKGGGSDDSFKLVN